MLGQFGQQTGGLTPHAHGPRQSVDEHQNMIRDRSSVGRRNPQIEKRVPALQLLVGEHALLNAQALSQQFTVVGRVTQEQL